MRTSWFGTPLLLLLAVLALAGTAGERYDWPSGTASAAAAVDGGGDIRWIGDAHEADQAILHGGRARTSSLGVRDSRDGPAPGRGRHLPVMPVFRPLLHSGQLDVGYRVAVRTRLRFAHDVALRIAGACSSFGTTLPPPLLA